MDSKEGPSSVPETSGRTIIGHYQVLVNGPKGPRVERTVDIASSEGVGPYSFIVLDPETKEVVDLPKAHIVNVYRQIMDEEPPRHLTEKTDKYYKIKDKHKTKKRNAA